MKPSDNDSNMKNANKGTIGTNQQYDQVHGNRGQQLNLKQSGQGKTAGNHGTQGQGKK